MNVEAPSKNLILGCAFNYSKQDILPFLNSLQACGYTGHLVLLTNNQSSISLEGYAYDGQTINVDQDFKFSAQAMKVYTTAQEQGTTETKAQRIMHRALTRLQKEKPLSKPLTAYFYNLYFLMTARYFLYYHYLLNTNYTHVLLTDVNDVFFQRNPFEQPYENGVTAFAEYEAISVKEEVTNNYWIQETFGDAVLQAMGNEVVYCAGTIMLKNSVLPFLKDFLSIVIRQQVSPVIQGVDQAVFNYMISFLKLDYFDRKQNGDMVLTVANVPEPLIAITEAGMSLKNSRQLPSMVHQYTRFPQQKKYAVDTFGQVTSTGILPH